VFQRANEEEPSCEDVLLGPRPVSGCMRSGMQLVGLQFVLLASVPSLVVAQLRLLQPPDPSVCAMLCADGRCDASHVRPIQAVCDDLTLGQGVKSVGQMMLLPRGGAWEWSGPRSTWILPNATVSIGGGAACMAELDSMDEAARSSLACSGCAATPRIESDSGPVVALVTLHHCSVHEKALRLHQYAAVVAIARRKVDHLGLYSQHAKVYYTPLADEERAVRENAAAAVMVDKFVGLTLLALLRFTNTTSLRVEIALQGNAWDEECFEPTRWLVQSIVAWAMWSCLLVLAVHNVRSHIRAHGVRVRSDKVMRILLTVLATTLAHFARECWMWARTSLGDVVSPWVDQSLASLCAAHPKTHTPATPLALLP
jgi:hypothetical protein